MTNAIYPLAKQSFLTQSPSIDIDTDTIKCALVDTGTYTYSASHQYLSSVSSAIVGTPVTLASITCTNGVLDAGDVTFSSITGSSAEALVIYKDTGSAATSPLICYIDTVSSGLPVIPNGGNITVTWDNGANKIFAL